MDRITFIDAATKKVLLGTYVRQDNKVLSVGEALLDDPKLDILNLLHETSLRKPVTVAKNDTFRRGRKKQADHCCTCVAGDAVKLRLLQTNACLQKVFSPHISTSYCWFKNKFNVY